ENDLNFGFSFNLKEKWPRGQWSALAMMAEVGEKGAWSNLFRKPNLEKFNAPTLTNVDFPDLLVSQAFNNKKTQTLNINLLSKNSLKANKKTKIKISKIPDLSTVKVRRDGYIYDMWKAIGKNEIEIEVSYSRIYLEIYTGWSGETKRKPSLDALGSSKLEDDIPAVAAKPISLKVVEFGNCPCCF
ncbi:hypothetical protein CBE37_00780, partial [bacterium TMED277]